MNKDRAIELLKNDCCYECSWGCRNPIECNNKECDYRQALGIAIESLDENERLKKERDYILEKAKAELKDNEWVDVRDRLPSEDETVLVNTYDGDIRVARRRYNTPLGNIAKEEWVWITSSGYYRPDSIIAWKPLPKPYERKGDK